jgi:hypothetical protein
MLSRSIVRIRVALLALCVCSATMATSQRAAAQVATAPSATGTISGIATDETGAAPPDYRRLVGINTTFRF